MSRNDNTGPEVLTWELKKPLADPANMSIDLGLPKDISRQCFREPIGPEENIVAEFNGQKFQIIDIGSRGIGLSLPAPVCLTEGQTVDIEIVLYEELIRFQGKVVHISQKSPENFCHCGIEFVDIMKETEKKLREFIQKHHAELFGRALGFL